MADRKRHTGVGVTRPRSASTWSLSEPKPILIYKDCSFVLQGSLQCLIRRLSKVNQRGERRQQTKSMKVDEIKAGCVSIIEQFQCHSR